MIIDAQSRETCRQRTEYLVASLLDYFRDPRSESSYYHAANIATGQLRRDVSKRMEKAQKRFLFLARMLKDNISPASIRNFASSCIDWTYDGHFEKKSKVKDGPMTQALVHRVAKKEMRSALSCGHSPESSVNRVANELIKRKRNREFQNSLMQVAARHPLKSTLFLTGVLGERLAKEDIRNHLLSLKSVNRAQNNSGGKLFELLLRAQAFSPQRSHELLGDDLFFLCKPLGFLDQNSSVILIEVPTSAHLHALTYRKSEIIRALKKDKAFSRACNIRFRVSHAQSDGDDPYWDFESTLR